MRNSQHQPDPVAKAASHVAVGIASAIVASYVIVGILGIRKNSEVYALLAAAGAMWMHAKYDLPLANAISQLGI